MAWTRRKIIFRTVLLAFLAVLCFAGWVDWRYVDTASMACECGDPVDNQRFALFNPFRDRTPEHVATSVIKALQSGECQAISQAERYCPEEQHYKITSWKLTGIRSSTSAESMRFWVVRTQGDRSSFGDPVWVTVQQQGNSWKVTNVDMYY
jgi:hypothetical protein